MLLRQIDRERLPARMVRHAMTSEIAHFLSGLRNRLAAAARNAPDRVQRDQKPKHAVEVVADEAPWSKLGKDLRPHIQGMAQDGAREALEQVADAGAGGEPPSGGGGGFFDLLQLANKRAIEWADDHAAELVGMRKDPDTGEWVTNQRPGMAISETTRKAVQELVSKALDEGWTNDELADEIMGADVFSEARAEMIARTETAFADIEGNIIGWKTSGVVEGKQWTIGTTQTTVCDDCASLDGVVVGIDEEFPDGDPPLHPNCRCDVLPVLSEDEDEETEDA